MKHKHSNFNMEVTIVSEHYTEHYSKFYYVVREPLKPDGELEVRDFAGPTMLIIIAK